MSIKTYGSLFAGVGGIDLGLDAAGLECKFQVEWDTNCIQTLNYHWPHVAKWGDISQVNGEDLPFVDLISFGSPCQDLSTAGKKTGLKGERSGLFYQAVRIIKEMREKSNGQYPKWTIWENVTGALSSNRGADFGQVLWEMDEAGACFSEWAVLDAQYFGVPQRRRRIYLLSVFDSGIAARCPDKILPIQQSSSGNTSKSRKKEQQDTMDTASCLRSGGEGGVPSSRGENLIVVNDSIPIQGTIIGRSDTAGPQGKGFGDTGDPSYTLDTISQHAVMTPDLSIRKFTPLECERLMGWPDNHTLHRADGNLNSDNVRYKMCGNGVASPVIKWIAEKIINI